MPDGTIACHTCDNPRCCNPTHLYAGTYKDNNHDMHERGRERHASDMLLKRRQELYLEIKSLDGIMSCELVGEIYGISYSRVAQIWRMRHGC
jgi:hypothetical protein